MAEQDWKHGLTERHIGWIIRRKMMERTYSSKKEYNRKKLKQNLKSQDYENSKI
jgi:hypothetical protein